MARVYDVSKSSTEGYAYAYDFVDQGTEKRLGRLSQGWPHLSRGHPGMLEDDLYHPVHLVVPP